jgi:hypothetical protein
MIVHRTKIETWLQLQTRVKYGSITTYLNLEDLMYKLHLFYKDKQIPYIICDIYSYY